MADRSLNLDTQKMLLEINRQLISDPWLWWTGRTCALQRNEAAVEISRVNLATKWLLPMDVHQRFLLAETMVTMVLFPARNMY
jgi:hypothetical protein